MLDLLLFNMSSSDQLLPQQPNESFYPSSHARHNKSKTLVNAISELMMDDGDVDKLKDYPPRLEQYQIKFFRSSNSVTQNIKNLERLCQDEKTKVIQNAMKASATGVQQKYAIVDEIKRIQFPCTEVTCRLVSSSSNISGGATGPAIISNVAGCGIFNNTNNNTNTTINFSRIGAICFKSKAMKDVIDLFMNKCMRELNERFGTNANDVNQPAMYIENHIPHKCKWKCDEILKYALPNHGHLNNGEKLASSRLCFSNRQFLGQQCLYPYVQVRNETPDESESQDEEGEKENNNDENLLFDNLFWKNNKIQGVDKLPIPYAAPNLLHTISERGFPTPVTALMNFSIDYIGIVNGGLSLYLKQSNACPIYFTDLTYTHDINSASEYLEEILYSNQAVRNILVKNGKRVPDRDEDDEFDMKEEKENENENENEKENTNTNKSKRKIKEEEEEEEEEEEKDVKKKVLKLMEINTETHQREDGPNYQEYYNQDDI